MTQDKGGHEIGFAKYKTGQNKIFISRNFEKWSSQNFAKFRRKCPKIIHQFQEIYLYTGVMIFTKFVISRFTLKRPVFAPRRVYTTAAPGPA
jgi:hypothetical protein